MTETPNDADSGADAGGAPPADVDPATEPSPEAEADQDRDRQGTSAGVPAGNEPCKEVLAAGATIGIYLAVLAVLLLYAVYVLWPRANEPAPGGTRMTAATAEVRPTDRTPAAAPPSAETAGPSAAAPPAAGSAGEVRGEDRSTGQDSGPEEPPHTWNDQSRLLGFRFELSPPVRVLLLVILIGALGSVMGGATSFATYMGNKTFDPSWSWWYYLRPVVGSVLALALYLVIRAGFFEAFSFSDPDQHLFRAAAIAALAGMFSKLTADKLEDVFAAVLQSNKDKHRRHKANNDGA